MNANESQLKVNPWLVAVAVMLGTFMEVLDTSIANVSLDHIAGSLSASLDEATWVLTSYLIANAIVIPTSGWLGQKFGRKRFLMTCIALFTLSSVACGMAGSLGMLLLARVLQGAGGGALQPVAQAVILEAFPREKQGQAMAFYGLGVVVAPIIGPVLGGWITDNYDWRWIFFINLPVGIAALWMVQRFVHDPQWMRNTKATRFDLIGFSFLSLWLGCQEVIFDKGQEDDWFGSRFIMTMAVVSVTALIAFVVRELTTDKPVVNLRVLANRNFALGVFMIALMGVALYGLTAVLPLFLQSLMGYTALQSGWSVAPRGVGAVIAMAVVGKLILKIPGRYLAAFGFMILGVSSFVLTRINLDMGPAALFWPIFFSGVALGFVFVPLNTLAMGALPPEQLGNASGLYNLMRNVGGSVGISIVTTIAARSAQAHQNYLAAHLTPYDSVYRSSLQALQVAYSANVGTAQGAAMAGGSLYNQLLQQASFLAYLDVFFFFAVLCAVCVGAALLLKNVKSRGPIAAH